MCLDWRENQSIPPKRKKPPNWRRCWLIIRDGALSEIRYYLVVILLHKDDDGKVLAVLETGRSIDSFKKEGKKKGRSVVGTERRDHH